MIAKILSTTATRFLTALISFAIVIINSRNIGPQGVGTIGIIILDITVIAALSGFFGGSSFVYFTPRKRISHLFLVSVMTSLAGPLLFALIYYAAGRFTGFAGILAPGAFVLHIFLLSFILVLHSNNMSIILGREKIFVHNIITVLQQLTMIATLLFLFFAMEDFSVMSYIKAYYAGLLFAFIPSVFFVLKEIKNDKREESFSVTTFGEIINYGFTVQLASLFQVFNYRLPYYFLKSFFPAGNRLGVYTVGTQLSEGLWIIGKSISMVQYSRISNVDDRKINSDLTINLLKFSVLSTFVLLLILLILPVEFYVYIFNFEAFAQVKTVIFYLSPGILALTANMILSHYLSGTGKPVYNMIVSFLGLVIITISGYFLIKSYGLEGAALAASLTYVSTMLFSFYFYFRHSSSKIKDLIIKRSDFRFFFSLLRKSIGK